MGDRDLALPEHRPFLVRGDCGFGNDTVLREMETRQQPYLFKMKQSKNVRRLLVRQFQRDDWVDAGQGWKAVEDEINLAGWENARRPLLLAAIGRTVRHGGQSQLYLTPMHAAGRVIAAMISGIRTGLRHVKHIAEQSPSRDRWELSESSTCWLVRYIVDRILATTRAVRRNQSALPAPAAG